MAAIISQAVCLAVLSVGACAQTSYPTWYPTYAPTVSQPPSLSSEPSTSDVPSLEPSVSSAPTKSNPPSFNPSLSIAPSVAKCVGYNACSGADINNIGNGSCKANNACKDSTSECWKGVTFFPFSYQEFARKAQMLPSGVGAALPGKHAI
eukprot:scaffold304_cov80-Skeletonema_menzelii.AAC.23